MSPTMFRRRSQPQQPLEPESNVAMDEEPIIEKPKTPEWSVPSNKATPADVREFFELLLAERGIEDDDSHRIVAAWKIGSGIEMRQYSPAMYLEIFGREYGWILYREAKMSVRNERNVLVRRPLWSISAVALAVMITTIVLLNTVDMGEGSEAVVIVASVAGFITLIVCSVMMCFGSSPSAIIQRELRACTKTLKNEEKKD